MFALKDAISTFLIMLNVIYVVKLNQLYTLTNKGASNGLLSRVIEEPILIQSRKKMNA